MLAKRANNYPFTLVLAFFTVLSIGLSPLVMHAQEKVVTPEVSSLGVENLLGLYPTEQIPGDGAVVGDFVVGPGKVDITINPGESKTVEMIVTNRTGERRKFNFTKEDTQASSNPATSIMLLGDDRGPYSLKDYISVPHTSFVLDHNQRARIPVTISIPQDAEAGGLYGSVLVDTVAIDAKSGGAQAAAPQSAIIARIGTLFFITIPGDVAREGILKDIGVIPEKLFYQSSPITIGILFENTGSIHLAPYGELRIRNIFNEEVGFMQLEPWFVLPQSLRLREVTWTRDILFGRYVATAYINRSYDNIIDEQSVVFWILPWKQLLGIFGAVFLVVFVTRMFFKNFEFRRKSE